MDFVKEHGIEATKIGKDKYYYFANSDGVIQYYTRSKINMYNKLYVYVN